jgi:ATP synthase I chain
MTADPLKKISRANLVLGAAITAVAGPIWGAPGMLGAGVGAALACLNFFAIGRLGRRAVRRVEAGASSGQALALAAGLIIKMTALFALVWVAVRVIKLPALPFALGMSVFVFSILLVGLGGGWTSDASSDTQPDPAGHKAEV